MVSPDDDVGKQAAKHRVCVNLKQDLHTVHARVHVQRRSCVCFVEASRVQGLASLLDCDMCGRLTGVGAGRGRPRRRWSAGSVGCGRRRAPENNGSVRVELELEVDSP